MQIEWNDYQRLIQKLAMTFFKQHKQACRAAGVTYEDLCQEAYFAFLKAKKAFNPQKNVQFATYLKYPVRACFFKLCGYAGRRQLLNEAGGGVELAVMPPQTKPRLGGLLEGLSAAEKQFLTLQFVHGLSPEKAAKACGLSRKEALAIKQAMRKSPAVLRAYWSRRQNVSLKKALQHTWPPQISAGGNTTRKANITA